MGETHINMQTIRWPFMNRYSVPTVLGTPAEVVIESTVATALRGNITFPVHLTTTMRNHQIDMRYSSYATCLSRCYNPFLNYEHQVQQDQGFLGYIPINSELGLDLVGGGLSLSFIRPKMTNSGFALKSRMSVNIREFFLLDSDTRPSNHFIYSESEDDRAVSVLDWDIGDLGTKVQLSVGVKKIMPSIFEFTNLLMPENGHMPQIAGQALQTANILQVITTHLGNYKYIKWLIRNEEDSKILLTFNLLHDHSNSNPDLFARNLNIELTHTNDLVNRNATALHRWSAMVRLMTTKSSGKHTIQASLKRISEVHDASIFRVRAQI